MTSLLFDIPIIRHVYTWLSAASVDKKTLIKLNKKGISLNICPGGVREVAYLGNKKERVLFLKKRQNFTKLAIQLGAPLVPTYIFGQEKVFDFIISENETILTMGRKLGFLPMIFFGAFGLPLGIPKPSPLTVLIGKPIIVPQNQSPTQDDVDQYHQLLISAIEKLYIENREAHGLGHVPLRIE